MRGRKGKEKVAKGMELFVSCQWSIVRCGMANGSRRKV
jgi:hypothetical protein